MDPVYTEVIGNTLLLLGGIATLQAAVFVLWRLTVITRVMPASAQPHCVTAPEPGYLRAIVWPTLAMVGGVCRSCSGRRAFRHAARPGARRGSPKCSSYRQWQEASC